jgi:hypothetical protein
VTVWIGLICLERIPNVDAIDRERTSLVDWGASEASESCVPIHSVHEAMPLWWRVRAKQRRVNEANTASPTFLRSTLVSA